MLSSKLVSILNRVTILERDSRVGGRIYTKYMEVNSKSLDFLALTGALKGAVHILHQPKLGVRRTPLPPSSAMVSI